MKHLRVIIIASLFLGMGFTAHAEDYYNFNFQKEIEKKKRAKRQPQENFNRVALTNEELKPSKEYKQLVARAGLGLVPPSSTFDIYMHESLFLGGRLNFTKYFDGEVTMLVHGSHQYGDDDTLLTIGIGTTPIQIEIFGTESLFLRLSSGWIYGDYLKQRINSGRGQAWYMAIGFAFKLFDDFNGEIEARRAGVPGFTYQQYSLTVNYGFDLFGGGRS